MSEPTSEPIRESEAPLPELPIAGQPFWTYGDLAFAILIYGALSVVATVTTRSLPGGLLLGQLLSYGVWFALLAGFFRLKYGQPFWSSLGWHRSGRGAAVGVQLGVALMALAIAVGQLAHLPDVDTPLRALLNDPKMVPLTALAVVGVGPLAEELFFRGLAQPLLTRSFGAVGGILLTAVPFGLLHAEQLKNSWPNVALIVVAGVAFGAVRYKLDSVFASTVMHATYNGLLLTGYLMGKNLLHG